MDKSETVDVRGMIRAYLIANGYDGLTERDNKCACDLDDLVPCCFLVNCIAGHKIDCDCGEGCDFHIKAGRRYKI